MNPTHTTMRPEATPAEVLRAAADHIERYGFNQGSYYDNPVSEHPATCAAGAIAIAAYGEPVAMPETSFQPGEEQYKTALTWIDDYLDANHDRHHGQPIGVYAWNDSPATTGADVIDTLRAAAAAWDTDNAGGDPS